MTTTDGQVTRFPIFEQIEQKIAELARLSPSQIAQLLELPMRSEEYPLIRASRLFGWALSQPVVGSQLDPHSSYQNGSRELLVTIFDQFGVPVDYHIALPRSVGDYVECELPPTLHYSLDGRQAVAVAALADHLSISPEKLIGVALTEFVAQHGHQLERRLRQSPELAQKMTDQGLYPDDFREVAEKVCARFYRALPSLPIHEVLD